jgi:predicted secreted protein
MGRSAVSSLIAIGLMAAGIIIGATGYYVATTYQTKIVTVTTTQSTTTILTETLTQTLKPATTALANGTEVYIIPTVNGTYQMTASKGETFAIQLSSNGGSTGYSWNFKESSGIAYVNSTLVSASQLVGGPITYNYFFMANQAGSQTITLVYERTFSNSIADIIDIIVTVS